MSPDGDKGCSDLMRLLIVLLALGLAIPSTALSSPAYTSGLASLADRASACPSLADAGTLSRRPGGGLLHADIDGDGFSDAVSVRYALDAPSSCGFLLVIETR